MDGTVGSWGAQLAVGLYGCACRAEWLALRRGGRVLAAVWWRVEPRVRDAVVREFEPLVPLLELVG